VSVRYGDGVKSYENSRGVLRVWCDQVFPQLDRNDGDLFFWIVASGESFFGAGFHEARYTQVFIEKRPMNSLALADPSPLTSFRISRMQQFGVRSERHIDLTAICENYVQPILRNGQTQSTRLLLNV
jgi:hypothetical protein